jgi:hypothetical protein
VRGRLTPGLVALRVTGLAALALLLWNPAVTRPAPGSARPLVLLDASLSMSGVGGHWAAALDSARAAARGGVIWRFGAGVGAFDSAPPGRAGVGRWSWSPTASSGISPMSPRTSSRTRA